MSWQRWERFQALLRREISHLATFNPTERRWQMPFCAALANGLPLLVGAYFDHLDYGLVSSLGGLVFLYAPNTPPSHRQVSLMASAFGLGPFHALGVMSQPGPALRGAAGAALRRVASRCDL